MRPTLVRIVALAVLGSIAMLGLQARAKKPAKGKKQPAFAYLMLVLSYAPDFCAQPSGDKDPRECGIGRKVGFVVHGLWPQGETTRGPENCGPASAIPDNIVQDMLHYFPTEALMKHEWAAHGTCSGLSVENYFAAVKKTRDSVTIPEALTPSSQTSMKPADIQGKVAAANPTFPGTAFRISCYPDKELQEVRVCLNKDLSPRPCGSSAGQCPAKQVVLLPVH
jgi:ribonuclease T2